MAKKKKKSDRSEIEQRLGKAVHQAGKMELLSVAASKALDAVARQELIAHNHAIEQLDAARAKIVEINNELSALDK